MADAAAKDAKAQLKAAKQAEKARKKASTDPADMGRIKQIVKYRIAGDSLQAERSNKCFRPLCHHHADISTAIAQAAHQLRCFISSNTAAHAKKNFFAG